MSIAYKKLLNEFKNLLQIEKELIYKICIINSVNTMFRCDIKLIYYKLEYNIKIYYNKFYPFEGPSKLEINNNNILDIYRKIETKNITLFNYIDLINESIVYNWNISFNTFDIIKEVKKIINYNELYIKRILLNKIIKKYTDLNLDFLELYLI